MTTTAKKETVVLIMNDVLRGGAQRIAVDIAHHAQKTKITHVVYFQEGKEGESTFKEDFISQGVVLVCIGPHAGFVWRCVLVARFLKTHRPGVVHTLLPYASFVGRIAGVITGIPVISTQCNLPFAYTYKIRLVDALTLPLVAAWVGATHAIEIAYGGKGAQVFSSEAWEKGRRHFTAYGGVSVEDIQNGMARVTKVQKRQDLGISPDAYVILMVARFVAWKGHADLIRALALLPTDTQLLLVGFGGEEDVLRALVDELNLTERVHFLGARNDVYELLAAADVYAQTHTYSEHDAAGWQGPNLSQIEAAAAGVPVVSTNVPLTEVLFEKEKTGWLATPNDPKDIARAIMGARDNPEKAHGYALAATTRVKQLFSIDHMVYTYEEIYARCLRDATV